MSAETISTETMPAPISVEKIPPTIKQTLVEKVLIKNQALSAEKYQKTVIKHAHTKANDVYQQAVAEQDNIYQIAYQQGYNGGVKQLLNDFISALDASEKAYQEQVNQSEKQLEQVLNTLFNDSRLQEIVAHHFINQQAKSTHINLHLPANMQQTMLDKYPEVSIVTSAQDTLALEVDNKICYFSAPIAAKNTLPQIFSVSIRCQILEQRKKNYQNLIELVDLAGEKNEHTHQ